MYGISLGYCNLDDDTNLCNSFDTGLVNNLSAVQEPSAA